MAGSREQSGIGVLGAAAIGVGGMVGGIFAMLLSAIAFELVYPRIAGRGLRVERS